MAIIRFTEADKLRGRTLEKGGYSAELVKMSGPTASSSQKSVTYQGVFQITKGPFVGKELEVFFNTETSGNSLLGTRQYCPHDYLLKVKAAVDGISFDQLDVSQDFDTDTLLHKPLDIIVGVETSGGNIGNIILNFVPSGKAQAAVPF